MNYEWINAKRTKPVEAGSYRVIFPGSFEISNAYFSNETWYYAETEMIPLYRLPEVWLMEHKS